MPRKTRQFRGRSADARVASMRPRPDATENAGDRNAWLEAGDASMRPRPDATENVSGPWSLPLTLTGFNEAAARCHGKRHRDGGRQHT